MLSTKTNLLPLHYAAKNGYVDVAKVLIQNGADVNAEGRYNLTALPMQLRKDMSMLQKC